MSACCGQGILAVGKGCDVRRVVQLLVLVAVACPPAVLLADDSEGEAQETYKSGYGDLEEFGGPASTAAELKEADRVKSSVFRFENIERGLESWFEWKSRMFDDYGLSLGFDVNWLYQRASASLGQSDAFGAIYRLRGEWAALGRGSSNTGSLVYRVEYRDNHFTDVAPAAFGKEIGTASITTGFAYASNFGPTVSELYWKQLFNDKRFGFVVGILDFGPYFDYYPYTTLGKGFLTREFLLNPTLATTGVGHLGAAAKGFFGDHVWVGGALYDANAVNGELNLDTWDSSELLKHVEIGWTPARKRSRTDRVQVTYWEVDERLGAGLPAGSGWALSISGELGERFVPFFRVGDTDGGGGAPAEQHISVGFGKMLRRDDRISVALARNKPSRKTNGEDLDYEYLVEASYQLQASQNVSLLPNVQLIIDPANYPTKSHVWVFSLRIRLTL